MWNAPDYVAEQALIESSRIQRQVWSTPKDEKHGDEENETEHASEP